MHVSLTKFKVMAAVMSVRAWLAAGHGAPEVVLGKLLSSSHPAVAAAESYSSR